MLEPWKDYFGYRLVVRCLQQARREVAERNKILAPFLTASTTNIGQHFQQQRDTCSQEISSRWTEARQISPADATVLQLVGQVPPIERAELGVRDDGATVPQDETPHRFSETTQGNAKRAAVGRSYTRKSHGTLRARPRVVHVLTSEATRPITTPERMTVFVENRPLRKHNHCGGGVLGPEVIQHVAKPHPRGDFTFCALPPIHGQVRPLLCAQPFHSIQCALAMFSAQVTLISRNL